MRDSIALDRALEQYLNWKPTLPILRSAERRVFDSACDRWDYSNRQHPQETEPEPVVPTPPIGLDKDKDIGEITFAPPVEDGDMSASYTKDEFGDVMGDGAVRAHARNAEVPRPGPSSLDSETLVQTRLSRTFRVFAAWKP